MIKKKKSKKENCYCNVLSKGGHIRSSSQMEGVVIESLLSN